jgi:hypothetical protein
MTQKRLQSQPRSLTTASAECSWRLLTLRVEHDPVGVAVDDIQVMLDAGRTK